MVSRYAKAQLPMTFMTRRVMLKTSVQKRLRHASTRGSMSLLPALSSWSTHHNDLFRRYESVCRQCGLRRPLEERLLLVVGKARRVIERRVVARRHRTGADGLLDVL